MRRLALGLAFAAFTALVAAVAFVAGGLHGFVHGYLAAAHANGVSAATLAVTSLGASAKGDPETARNLLETLVDTALTSEWSRQKIGFDLPFYAPDEYDLDFEAPLRRIAEHRRSHPRPREEGDGPSLVDDVVARYTSGAEAR